MEAEYKLQMPAQNMFQRAFEYIKAKCYWNTQTKQLDEDNNNGNYNGRQGNVQASVVIDPITQKHANLTVKTRLEVVRIESLELPGQFRPFPMIRPSEKSTHSMQQLFARWTVSNRAECTVDGRRVNTFDNVDYKAPISKCYSVLAKDCSSEEPRFVVLMKALDNQSREKKIKVITPEQSIECQPKNAGNNNNNMDEENRYKRQKLQCKVNGQTVDEHDNEIEDQTIEYNNNQKTDVTINVQGVSVRFNGVKAWIKVRRYRFIYLIFNHQVIHLFINLLLPDLKPVQKRTVRTLRSLRRRTQR
jgi:hypothetical protein